MPRPGTLMYAELLSNIRQISVIAALDTPCDSSTKVELSPDGQRFLLHHGGSVNTLNLPGSALASFQLQLPILGAKELSWRLPLAGEPRVPSAENSAPWSAKDLKESTEFRCRDCGEVIVAKKRIAVWKDLPSENWAEMMDFWHCHKPSIHEPNSSDGSGGHSRDNDPAMGRGYGANTKFSAQPKIGFVDLTTILLAEPDCVGIEESLSGSSQYPNLVCKSCRNYLGHVDQHAEGYRLYKWRLKTIVGPALQGSRPYYQPSTSSIITAQMQSIMLAQCSSRLLLVPITWKPSMNPAAQEISASGVEPGLAPSCFLSLWILNPMLRYSATDDTSREPPLCCSYSPSGVLAMKVFWKCVDDAAANTLLESDGIEEMSLPVETIQEIEASLKRCGQFLPPSGRRFQSWDVGLLERFEEETI